MFTRATSSPDRRPSLAEAFLTPKKMMAIKANECVRPLPPLHALMKTDCALASAAYSRPSSLYLANSNSSHA